MELLGVLMVAYKEHIADQCIQTLTEVACLHKLFYLALRVELGLQVVETIASGNEIVVLHLLGALFEEFVDRPVGNVRTGEQVFLPMQAISLDLLACQRKRRRELPQQPVHALDGYFPNAEKAQHVVDTIGIEILRHVLETAHPPNAVVGNHRIPVVGGEAPILAVHREVVGWSTSLAVQVEVLGLHPDIATMAVHANRNVTLQDDSF